MLQVGRPRMQVCARVRPPAACQQLPAAPCPQPPRWWASTCSSRTAASRPWTRCRPAPPASTTPLAACGSGEQAHECRAAAAGARGPASMRAPPLAGAPKRPSSGSLTPPIPSTPPPHPPGARTTLPRSPGSACTPYTTTSARPALAASTRWCGARCCTGVLGAGGGWLGARVAGGAGGWGPLVRVRVGLCQLDSHTQGRLAAMHNPLCRAQIIGGSFISTGQLCSKFARYQFRPHFFQVGQRLLAFQIYALHVWHMPGFQTAGRLQPFPFAHTLNPCNFARWSTLSRSTPGSALWWPTWTRPSTTCRAPRPTRRCGRSTRRAAWTRRRRTWATGPAAASSGASGARRGDGESQLAQSNDGQPATMHAALVGALVPSQSLRLY